MLSMDDLEAAQALEGLRSGMVDFLFYGSCLRGDGAPLRGTQCGTDL